MNWQPIETAPKGKNLLLYFPTIKNNSGNITHWEMMRVSNYPVPYPRQPTQWMPLPEPPEAAA